MTTNVNADAQALAAALPAALRARSSAALEHLLAENVRWGGSEDSPETCHSRTEVLEYYTAMINSGVTFQVLDTVVEGPRVRVRLSVDAQGDGTSGSTQQVQVLTVRDGLVVDILDSHDTSQRSSPDR